MAHIELNNENLPGIVGLLDYSPATALPLTDLANVLLAEDNTLTRTEREIIAASVSYWNGCHFCHTSHAAIAMAHAGADISFIDDIKKGANAEITDKLRALLQIAQHVQQSGKKVTTEDIAAARRVGATDKEIHDTVLIAAAFCMYNRYVDGLGTWAPEQNGAYVEMGQAIAQHGYGVGVTTNA
jgi:uncharacterized peroxidase-related enzyme